jgi:hypothetical protein
VNTYAGFSSSVCLKEVTWDVIASKPVSFVGDHLQKIAFLLVEWSFKGFLSQN